MKTAREIANMILECFTETGECISVYGDCNICIFFDKCYTLATAYRMVLGGEYYG